MGEEKKFGYAIDFLPVGNGEKSGDAIAVRYGYPGEYKIMVIDGGTKESGQALVDHIKTYYKTDHVDYVVNTHPDADHASGLSVILEQMSVGELWIHRPWEHSSEIRDLFKDGRITDNSLSERLKDALNAAYALEELAEEKGVTIKEPFTGSEIGDFTILSPSEEWYLEVVPQFNKTPEAKAQEQSSFAGTLIGMGKSLVEKVAQFIEETWDLETLKEGGTTAAENLSSVVLYANLDGRGILFTGDAGIDSLNRAADYAESKGTDLAKCKFLQIPHHGSRNNVSPSVLDRIVGIKIGIDSRPTKTAFVSAAKDSKTHPRKVVTNAFKRRGADVIATQGNIKVSYHNMAQREGWVTAEPLPFYEEVEE